MTKRSFPPAALLFLPAAAAALLCLLEGFNLLHASRSRDAALALALRKRESALSPREPQASESSPTALEELRALIGASDLRLEGFSGSEGRSSFRLSAPVSQLMAFLDKVSFQPAAAAVSSIALSVYGSTPSLRLDCDHGRP